MQLYEEAKFEEEDPIIQEVQNGSVICTFFVTVAAEVAAGLILKTGEYVWKKFTGKKGNSEEEKPADMIDPEANQINAKK